MLPVYVRSVSALHYCFLVFQVLADQIFYRFYVNQQHFRSRFTVLCIIVFRFSKHCAALFRHVGFQEHQMTNSYLHSTMFNLSLVWQAKHDKSGLSWKSPIESQSSMCEIEKSLCEIGKSLREITKSLYEKLKLLYENEKMSCEIIITNREWKTAMWDLY